MKQTKGREAKSLELLGGPLKCPSCHHLSMGLLNWCSQGCLRKIAERFTFLTSKGMASTQTLQRKLGSLKMQTSEWDPPVWLPGRDSPEAPAGPKSPISPIARSYFRKPLCVCVFFAGEQSHGHLTTWWHRSLKCTQTHRSHPCGTGGSNLAGD